MKIAFVDCFSGISGDMLVGAFLDLGWPRERLLSLPMFLGLDGVKVELSMIRSEGIQGIHVDFIFKDVQPLRNIRAISRVIDNSSLNINIKKGAKAIFQAIAQAEARVHGCTIEDVHFHEIGAIDTIMDVVAVLLAIEDLGIQEIFCSPLPINRGFVKCRHGLVPLPAPAVLELLKEKPIYPLEEEREMVTPTGAAIITELTSAFGSIPEMKILGVGYGAGTYEFSSRPNLLRIIMGKRAEAGRVLTDTIVEIKTVIDDMTPEQIGHAFNILLDSGAIDVWVEYVLMKKMRPGFELVVLSPLEREKELVNLIFSETSASGVRILRKERKKLPRQEINVKTKWGTVQAKLIIRPGGVHEIAPEFSTCLKISKKFSVPLREVYSQVSRFTRK